MATNLEPDPMRILIVDDSEMSRQLLHAWLAGAGYTDVMQVDSGISALQCLTNPLAPREADIDLILLDIEMAGMDGIHTCRRLRAEPHLQDTPIIMVTGKADSETIAEAFSAGAMDYIVKPVQKVALLARVRSALNLKRETDARKAREEQLLAKNLDLQRALREIQVLRGLIKICSYCKKIQNDQGTWQQVELYIREHTEAEFSHGICAECGHAHFPDTFNEPLPTC
ncbi:MAG TPA: response regulator [Nitrospiraceae bacterium]|nr:response regulator [Nitrospiraceae bacterium]